MRIRWNSRLIGAQVEARMYLDHIEVWYGQKEGGGPAPAAWTGQASHRLPAHHRMAGAQARGLRQLPVRQVDLFPTSRFRMVYDGLRESTPGRASKEYLRILQLAAETGRRLGWIKLCARKLLAGEAEVAITVESIRAILAQLDTIQPVTMVEVALVDLASYDQLCPEMLVRQ